MTLKREKKYRPKRNTISEASFTHVHLTTLEKFLSICFCWTSLILDYIISQEFLRHFFWKPKPLLRKKSIFKSSLRTKLHKKPFRWFLRRGFFSHFIKFNHTIMRTKIQFVRKNFALLNWQLRQLEKFTAQNYFWGRQKFKSFLSSWPFFFL